MTSTVSTPDAVRRSSEQRQFLLGAFALLVALSVRAPSGQLPHGARFWTALAVSVAFAVAARLLRGVTLSGALAGTAVAFVIYRGLGSRGFAVLFAVFVVTWISTRAGKNRKQQIGVRQDIHGRTAGQVLANVGVAALLTFLATGAVAWLWSTAVVAALAEAAADTVSSEIGESTGRDSRLITTGEAVPAGTDGAVTLAGSAAGVLAAAAIAGIALALDLVGLRTANVAAMAGILGCAFDSVLGATFERRGLLGNNAVNLISTAFAAGIAVLAAQMLPTQ